MSNAKAEKCCGVIWNGAGYRNFICGKKGKVQRNGKWYCGRCDPDAVASRNAKAEARYQDAVNARIDARKAARIRDARAAAFPVLVEALRAIEAVQWQVSVDCGGQEFYNVAVNKASSALAQADAIEKEQP